MTLHEMYEVELERVRAKRIARVASIAAGPWYDPLRRRTPLKRKKGVKKVNRKHAAAKRRRNFGPIAFREWSHRQPCAFCGEAPRWWWNREYWGNDMAHVKDRGMGGCNSDWKLIVSCCPDCHAADKPRGQYALANEHHARWLAYCDAFGIAA